MKLLDILTIVAGLSSRVECACSGTALGDGPPNWLLLAESSWEAAKLPFCHLLDTR